MICTERFLRFEHVDAVEATNRGLTAKVHGERLRVDVVRADIVRVKISRGGTFDESPTFAVCIDPLGEDVEFTLERAEDMVRLRTSDLVVSLWLDPFRLDVHRSDGSAVIETATFVLSRAGSAGIQRYAANWMGDNQSRWDHLWLSMPMASGLGISGQAFVGADIGGFQGNSKGSSVMPRTEWATTSPGGTTSG